MVGWLFLFVAPLSAAAQQRVKPPVPLLPSQPNPLIADADAHYMGRQEGRVGSRASNREISKAIAGYETAARAPDSAEARWKLARALYFLGAYTGLGEDSQRAVYEKARGAGEEAIAIVERRAKATEAPDLRRLTAQQIASAVRSDPDAAPSYFWTAVAWGEWALAAGKLRAAKAGAAEKIRDHSSVVIAIDPEFEEGGGYRILGRLHHQAPRIPFLTGWVSREEAVKNLRLAIQTNASNFVNRLFLAEALAEGTAAERAEAIAIVEKLVTDAPSPIHLVEELKIQEDARRGLRAWRK